MFNCRLPKGLNESIIWWEIDSDTKWMYDIVQ